MLSLVIWPMNLLFIAFVFNLCVLISSYEPVNIHFLWAAAVAQSFKAFASHVEGWVYGS